MDEYLDAIELFIGVANNFRRKQTNFHSPLDEMVLKASGTNLAYVDNRRDAKDRYNYDFWTEVKKKFKNEGTFIKEMAMRGINEETLYSKSEQFPDFLFKVGKQEGRFIRGSLLELKDSKGGNIASFNSTIPTKHKSLEEVDIINGGTLVSKMTSVIDGTRTLDGNYYSLQRRNVYFIRTYKDNAEKVKISIVDGSFFETVPKEHLIYQMFLNILRGHLKQKNVKISEDLLKRIEESLSCITDQTIIAASQTIESASVRPRLRIMAEVHTEGNPHSSVYPKISERSLNLILQATGFDEEIKKMISREIPEVKKFTIQHKRNGKHVVFEFTLKR